MPAWMDEVLEMRPSSPAFQKKLPCVILDWSVEAPMYVLPFHVSMCASMSVRIGVSEMSANLSARESEKSCSPKCCAARDGRRGSIIGEFTGQQRIGGALGGARERERKRVSRKHRYNATQCLTHDDRDFSVDTLETAKNR